MFSVYKCVGFQYNPKEWHLLVVKRIYRYLVGTIDYGLWYPRTNDFNLVGYSDASYAWDIVDR